MGQSRIVVFIMLCTASICFARMSFNNVNCTSLDKNFTDFEYCYIKAVNRTYQYVSLKVKLYKVPITNVSIRVALMKRANGYKPFLYNYTFDACAFFKGRRNPVSYFFYSIIEKFSNMNHSCPYDHDLILEKMSNNWIEDLFTNKLPMPKGDYAILTTWLAYNIPRAVFNFYTQLF